MPLRLKVAGVYLAPNVSLPYWWGQGAGYFAYGHASGPRGTPLLDSLISSAATALAVPHADLPVVIGQVPLRPSAVTLSNEPALRGALAAATASVGRQQLVLRTPLPAILSNASHQRHVMSTIVAVAAIQLVLLAIWVLASLLVRNADARRSEIRVARLRGFPARTVFAVAAAEPAMLCLIGVPFGVGLAWLAVVIARGQLLNPAAAIAPDIWVFAALAATVLAIVAALGVGTFRLLRASGLSEARKPAEGLSRQSALIADALMLGLSVVALIALATSGALAGHSDPIASAAPGLIALGGAVIAVQLVLFALPPRDLRDGRVKTSGWDARDAPDRATPRRAPSGAGTDHRPVPGLLRQLRVVGGAHEPCNGRPVRGWDDERRHRDATRGRAPARGGPRRSHGTLRDGGGDRETPRARRCWRSTRVGSGRSSRGRTVS